VDGAGNGEERKAAEVAAGAGQAAADVVAAGCDYFRCFSRRAIPIKKWFHRGIRRKNLL